VKKLSIVKTFIKEIYKDFSLKLIAVFLLGIANSFLQGVGIVMIIPLLEAYRGDKSNKFTQILTELGWNGDLETLLLFYLLILVFYGILKSLYTLLSQSVVSQFTNDYSIKAIKTVFNASWMFYLKISPSQLINLFKTESRSIKILSNQSFRWLQTICLIFIQLTFALWISVKLTLITLFVLVLLYLLQKVVFKTNYKLGEGRVQLSEKIQRFFNESFGAIKLLKLHNMESKRVEEYTHHIQGMYDNEMNKARVDAFSDLLYICSGALVLIGVIYTSLTFNWLDVSGLLVLLVLLSRLIAQSQSIVKITLSISNSLPSFQRFSDILNQAKKFQVAQINRKKNLGSISTLSFDQVSFSYGEKNVLDQKSFTLEKGKMYLLFGPSGKGKTTTLDVLSGLISPQEGRILIDGKEASIEDRILVQKGFSYVLQETILFEGSIRDNITFFQDYPEERLNEVIKQVGLFPLINSLDEGFNTFIREGGSRLSGGEKQRIALARSLIIDSKVLLLDEITSSLDRKNEQLILALLQELKKDRIIIFVSHKENMKDLVDEIISF
jgi:ABC-type multidrug transport system fused ATPase/permease subunit